VIVLPPLMVERNVWGSNLRRFAAAATGVMIGSLATLNDARQSQFSEADYSIRGLEGQRKYLFVVTKMEQAGFGIGSRWLDPAMTNVEAVSEMLKPCDARMMRSYPVSTRVNPVVNDDEECSLIAR
jgi:hypothetical protein